MADQKTCFIVGPIGEAGSPVRKLADWLLKGIIKPVLESEELGYTVKRADEDADPGSITNALITDLVEADLVIADLTGFNPNAFYELGIRHAMRMPAIHISAEAVRLPFDNKDQRTIFVDMGDFNSFEIAKRQLHAAVLATQADGYAVSNPVTQAVAINALRDSGDPRDEVVASLEARLNKVERQSAILEERIADEKAITASNRRFYGQGRNGFRTVATTHRTQDLAEIGREWEALQRIDETLQKSVESYTPNDIDLLREVVISKDFGEDRIGYASQQLERYNRLHNGG